MYDLPQGPKLVKRTIRPPRVAFIVDTLEQCETLIEICSLMWGGQDFCIIPYDSQKGIIDEWWRLLCKYDPDDIINCVELADETQQKIAAITEPYERATAERRLHFTPWNPSVHRDVVFGQSIYSALAGMGAPFQQDRARPVLAPKVPDAHSWSFYIKARYGSLNESASEQILHKANLKPELKLHDFIQVVQPEIGDDFLDFVLRHEPPFHWQHPQPLSLINYTLVELGRHLKPQNMMALDLSLVDRVNTLLVVSSAPSVEDFCCFWNFRAQRFVFPYSHLPFWLPLQLVRERQNELTALFRNRESPFGKRRAFLISKTVSEQELKDLARVLGEDIEVATDRIDRFYSPEYSIGIEDQVDVQFDKGRARIPLPDAQVIEYSKPEQYSYVDIEIPRYTLPQLNVSSWGQWKSFQYRVSRTGLSYRRMDYSSQKFIELALPSAKELLETYAALAAYTVTPSDKGKLAESNVALVSGQEYVWFLSGVTVHELLDQMSELSQAKEFKRRMRDSLRNISQDAQVPALDQAVDRILQTISRDRHERVLKTFGEIKRTLGFQAETTNRLIEWMIKQKLCFRGAELKCPSCGTKQWRVIDDISSMMRCAGCQQTVETPLAVDATQWSYRINSLYAKAHELGVIPHLLTIDYFREQADKSGTFDENIVIGTFYGVKLTAREGKTVPFPEIEIDVAWIMDGDLYMGECKTNAWELDTAEVTRYLEIGRLMRVRRIVFSVLDDVANIPADARALIDQSAIPVDLVGKDKLLNQFPGRAIIEQHEPERLAKLPSEFEAALKSYLEWIEQTGAQYE